MTTAPWRASPPNRCHVAPRRCHCDECSIGMLRIGVAQELGST